MCGSLFVVQLNEIVTSRLMQMNIVDNSQSAEPEPPQKKLRLMLTRNDLESESEDYMTGCHC